MRDIQTNNGNPSGVQLSDGAYGFVVVTVVEGNGQPADTDGVIIGNFRVTDDAGYEYRSNSQGFMPEGPIGSTYFINYNSVGGINKSDIIGITVNNLLSGEVTTAGSSATFDTSLFNNNEVLFSCSDTTFSCTENTFEYGINEAISHSRGKSVVCGSNNIPEGFVRLEVIDETATEAFIGFAGINTGDNSRGSMDSLVAVRTPICGDSIVDIGETCDPPGELQPPNDNECRLDCTFCGDGIMDRGEECDDGNSTPNDGCENDCTLSTGGCCDVEFEMCVDGLMTEMDCEIISSAVYLGDGTICDTAQNCPQSPPPDGACCFGVGDDDDDDDDDNDDNNPNPCMEVSELECENVGGVYQGDDTFCDLFSCLEQPMGACCIIGNDDDDSCEVSEMFFCEILGGEYQGDNTMCMDDICGFDPVPVP